jgi:hypothetical protein
MTLIINKIYFQYNKKAVGYQQLNYIVTTKLDFKYTQKQ